MLMKIQETNLIEEKSKGLEHILSAAKGEGPSLLQIQHLNDSIIDQHRVPSRPHPEPHRLVAKVELHPDLARELTVPVGEQQDLVADLEVLLPCAHHEGVIDGDAGDGVDALGAEVAGLFDEAREMLLGAGGGEGAGDGEEDGFLALGEVGDGGGLELAGGVEVGEGGVGEGGADGDGGGDGGGGGGGGKFGEFEGGFEAEGEEC
eukprot:TRINITY_DN12345_c0_g1_i1.p2 TRINITY_DN12345_c0_g1~~TRINITY_DN12345_c0_g1_i1.p2  ORF type:complete len:205 (+),score=39.93 TRINITY_DN12345_c0_g1_i1:425-1039(+)